MSGRLYFHHGHHHPLRQVATVTVIDPPAPIVDAAEIDIRQKLDLDNESPDLETADVEAMIAEATAQIDGPSGFLGRALGPQTLEMSLETHGGERFIELRYPPIISLTEIVYDDATGAEQTLDPTTYRLRRDAAYFLSGAPKSEDMRIRYRAGYATTDSPAIFDEARARNVKSAIKLMVGDMIAFRQSAQEGRWVLLPIMGSVENLLASIRIYPV